MIEALLEIKLVSLSVPYRIYSASKYNGLFNYDLGWSNQSIPSLQNARKFGRKI